MELSKEQLERINNIRILMNLSPADNIQAVEFGIIGELLGVIDTLLTPEPSVAPVAAVEATRRLWPMDPRRITIYERFSNNPSRHLASLTDPVMPVCGAKCVWGYEPQKGYAYPECSTCYRSDATSAGSE